MYASTRRYSILVLALGLTLAGVAPAQEHNAFISTPRTLPNPTVRETNRTSFAPELGTWNVYTGQLHAHTRGHDSPNAFRSWQLTAISAWAYGYDFFSRNNHSVSWADYDENRPYLQELWNDQGDGMVMINGEENYYDGGNWPPGSHAHPNHYNTINGWAHQESGPLWWFFKTILEDHDTDPQKSIHVQINHLTQPTADLTQLPSDPTRRDQLRRIVDTVEIHFGNGNTDEHMANLRAYFTMLRNGWRVSPTAHYDRHTDYHENDIWGARHADGTFVRPWVHYPGQPYEVVQRANGESGFAPHGRTGMVLPSTAPWSSKTFLLGLSERRTFRTTMDDSAGMYAANSRVMGDEFSLHANEKSLTFKVWGRSLPQHDGTRAPFTRAELWSPSRPDAPLRTVALDNTTDFGAELFTITPYDPVYLVRLVGVSEDHDIVMAPVWINNPRPKLNSARFFAQTTSGPQTLTWNGGGDRVKVQRARLRAPDHPRNWETLTEIGNIGYYQHNFSNEAALTYWRVVDAADETVISNELLFSKPNRSPLGSFEAVVTATGKVTGWSFDPDHPTWPTMVHVYAGGTFVTSGMTGLARPDVQQVHGAGAYSGYEIQLPSTYRSGAYQFYVYAIDPDADPNPLLGGSPRWGYFDPPGGGDPDPLPPICETRPQLPQCNPPN